jgi:hypothetical protein
MEERTITWAGPLVLNEFSKPPPLPIVTCKLIYQI